MNVREIPMSATTGFVRFLVLGFGVIACLAVGGSSAKARQSIDGNCNVQMGPNAQHNMVSIICLPKFDGKPSRSPSGGSRRPRLVIDATIERLKAEGRTFDVVLRNQSKIYRAAIAPTWLTLSDDRGNVYGIECGAMDRAGGCVREMVIPPGRVIRFTIPLDRPIARSAGEVYFSLSNIWYSSRGNPYSRPLGSVDWTVAVSQAPLDSRDRQAERANRPYQEKWMEEMAIERKKWLEDRKRESDESWRQWEEETRRTQQDFDRRWGPPPWR